MAKVEKDPFRCTECGWTSQKWVGRCGECQAWGVVEEIAAPKKLSLVAGNVTAKATPIGDVDLSTAPAAGQALVYNGADWVAANATGTVGALEIDVTVNASGEWVIDGTTYKRVSLVRGLTYYFNVNAVGNNFYLKTLG